MGCDIHLAVEVRERGKWHRVLPPAEARDPYYVEEAADRDADSWVAVHARVEWYHDRNYRVFAVLADVRNTGEITPIAHPRGIPEDVSDEVLRLCDPYILDGALKERRLAMGEQDEDADMSLYDHSPSWLTLAELQAYPWDGNAVQTGVVKLDQFMERVRTHGMGYPLKVSESPYTEWCRAVMGPGMVTREATEVLAAIRETGFAAHSSQERTHVQDKWITDLEVQAGSFTSRVLPALAQLGAPTDVRIVFAFDS